MCGESESLSKHNYLYNTAAEEEGKSSFSLGCILWVNCGLNVTRFKRVVASDECVSFNANVIMHLTSDPHLVDLWLWCVTWIKNVLQSVGQQVKQIVTRVKNVYIDFKAFLTTSWFCNLVECNIAEAHSTELNSPPFFSLLSTHLDSKRCIKATQDLVPKILWHAD